MWRFISALTSLWSVQHSALLIEHVTLMSLVSCCLRVDLWLQLPVVTSTCCYSRRPSPQLLDDIQYRMKYINYVTDLCMKSLKWENRCTGVVSLPRQGESWSSGTKNDWSLPSCSVWPGLLSAFVTSGDLWWSHPLAPLKPNFACWNRHISRTHQGF